MTHLVIGLDGTGQTHRDGTAIWQTVEAVEDAVAGNPAVLTWYDPGPGTSWTNMVRGTLFGRGMVENVRQALDRVEGCGATSVSIVGYSRGAYAARALAARLALRGVSIRFLGCIDTVPGPIPWGGKWLDLRLPSAVESALHLLACDETRVSFKPLLWEGECTRCEQVWLRGRHADLGDGRPGLGHAAMSLLWSRLELAGGVPTLSSAHLEPDFDGPLAPRPWSHRLHMHKKRAITLAHPGERLGPFAG